MNQILGQYEDVCKMIIEATQAEGVTLLIVNGNKGSSFSSTFTDLSVVDVIPKMLRKAADEIEAWNNKEMRES